jgi:hypothetical protein
MNNSWINQEIIIKNKLIDLLPNKIYNLKDIPKEKYENIFKAAYNRTEKYVKKPSNRTRKLKNYLP